MILLFPYVLIFVRQHLKNSIFHYHREEPRKIIIAECKTYLRDYENGMKPSYSTDLDMLIEIMNSE